MDNNYEVHDHSFPHTLGEAQPAYADQKPFYTTKDIEALPDGERAELIDGQIYYMSPPGLTHQRLLKKLAFLIDRYILDHQGSCEVFIAPFGAYINKDDRNYVEPDIVVICDQDQLSEKGCTGAPDWLIEIVSPGSKRMDYKIKLFKYRLAGVREYWIIDPQQNKITVCNFVDDTETEYTLSDRIKAGIYDDLIIDFSEITF